MTTYRIKRISLGLLATTALFALSGYSSCEPVLENNGFDLWCGDELCYWDLERGDIRKVSTWHSSDFGVSFDGDDVSIAQKTDNIPDCLRLSLVADVEETANVRIEIDVDDDGNADFQERIPASHWEPVGYQFALPPLRGLTRVRITKQGTGRAVLAQVRASQGEGCVRRLGELCSGKDQCDEGVCGPFLVVPYAEGEQGSCGQCTGDSDCRSNQVCGLDSPLNGRLFEMQPTCGAPARHQLGERCVADQECSTGVCCNGSCSTCCATPGLPQDGECPDGKTCEPAAVNAYFPPMMCSPGGGLGATGEPCLADADCTSGACTGAGPLSLCNLDGRVCGDQDDCPPDFECIEAGIAGGTCQ